MSASLTTGILVMRGLVASLPAERQALIRSIADALKQLVKDNGENGIIALTLAGVEIEIETEN